MSQHSPDDSGSAPTAWHQVDATVRGTDPETDLAVLKIDDVGELAPIEAGDSNELRLGDVVLAIGNPFGLGQTVTMESRGQEQLRVCYSGTSFEPSSVARERAPRALSGAWWRHHPAPGRSGVG